MNLSSDQLKEDERSVKKIASFEPRERRMDTQNNHQLTVCVKLIMR
jgi:hypothetical protein